eukprot:IDg18416t1
MFGRLAIPAMQCEHRGRIATETAQRVRLSVITKESTVETASFERMPERLYDLSYIHKHPCADPFALHLQVNQLHNSDLYHALTVPSQKTSTSPTTRRPRTPLSIARPTKTARYACIAATRSGVAASIRARTRSAERRPADLRTRPIRPSCAWPQRNGALHGTQRGQRPRFARAAARPFFPSFALRA